MLEAIDNYSVSISSHPKFNEWIANILLRKDNRIVVDVRFVEEPDNLAHLGDINQGGISRVYVSISYFTEFLSIIQNEKPLFVNLFPANSNSPARILLSTSKEPIGEQEA
jgi:hypothetical protein